MATDGLTLLGREYRWDRVDALRAEAVEAGDEKMVAICDAALDGDAEAQLEVAFVLLDAESAAEYAAVIVRINDAGQS
jgi:predicted RNA-binding protein with TRAM domain